MKRDFYNPSNCDCEHITNQTSSIPDTVFPSKILLLICITVPGYQARLKLLARGLLKSFLSARDHCLIAVPPVHKPELAGLYQKRLLLHAVHMLCCLKSVIMRSSLRAALMLHPVRPSVRPTHPNF